MELKVNALCLRADDVGESDKMIALAAFGYGKLSARVRSVKSPKAKLKLAASPFCFGEYLLVKKDGRFTVTGCSPEENFFPCWEDIRRYAAANIIVEILGKVIREEIDCGTETALALLALSSAAYSDTEPLTAAVWFLAKLTDEMGIQTEGSGIPEKILTLLESIKSADVAGLDSLGLSYSELYEILGYLNLIYREELSGKINSISEALKLRQ